jgi:flagellar basal body-associated protein FliL
MSSPTSCLKYSSDLICKEYHTSKNQCQTCFAKYEMDSNNKCILIKGCKVFKNDEKTCEECYSDFYLNSTTNQCQKRKQKNCLVAYLDQDMCVLCKPGFWMSQDNQNLCKPIDKIPFCLEYDQFENKCSNCEGGYVMHENACFLEVSNCKIYTDQGQCKECREKFEEKEGKCEAVVEKGFSKTLLIIFIICIVLLAIFLVLFITLFVKNRKKRSNSKQNGNKFQPKSTLYMTTMNSTTNTLPTSSLQKMESQNLPVNQNENLKNNSNTKTMENMQTSVSQFKTNPNNNVEKSK